MTARPWFAILALAIAVSAVTADEGALACPFCAAPLSEAPSFCAGCGRMVLDAHDPGRRSWLDAVFLVDYPPLVELPEIRLERGEKGTIARAAFLAGDRYEFAESKGQLRFLGEVAGWGAKSTVKYEGTIEDLRNESGRIVGRRVHGVLQAKPERHVVRTLEYGYETDGRLGRITVVTWHYRRASDAEKAPSAWYDHVRAEIVARYEDGRAVGVTGAIREAKRDLRGEPYFEEPQEFELGLDVKSVTVPERSSKP